MIYVWEEDDSVYRCAECVYSRNIFFSVHCTDADGSERGGGHQQADRGVRVSVLQGSFAVHGGRTEGQTHRPVQDTQLPWRTEEQQRNCENFSTTPTLGIGLIK